jgi:hypothetical protein
MITAMSEISAQEPAHDVLAAEAFAMPAPDPSLHRQPVVLPDDPTGSLEPHDVLAAEEFPMPAVHGSGTLDRARADRPRRLGLLVVAGAAFALLLARLLLRRR